MPGRPVPPDLIWTAGVDGCRAGWVVALVCFRGDDARPVCGSLHLCASFADVLALRPRARMVALDMPIGLLERAAPGGRACDTAARALLGRPRASSVFSPPARAALDNRGYRDAMLRNGGGMSRQTYNILPRVREVDRVMSPTLQRRMVEVHPELVFAHLHGVAIPCSKRTAAGQAHRLECLQRVWGEVLPDPAQARVAFGRRNVAVDDILDACVLAHAARRIVLGQGQRLPPGVPPRDARGLRMEIWF